MIIKLDLDKAYGRLEWGFIRKVLSFFNSPTLLHRCTSILLNGSNSESFTPSSGIRQGDPLSSYILILCMEYLSLQIAHACEENPWKPIKTSLRGPSNSHLFFADDLVFFAEASRQNCNTISAILEDFCSISGQKISLHKSKVLFSNNVNEEDRRALSSALGIPQTSTFRK